MPHVPITKFAIPIQRHVVKATDELAAIVMGVKDTAGTKIFNWAGRARNFRASIIRDDSPYALIYIGPKKVVKMTDRGVVVELTAEIIVDLIFTIPDDADYLAWGDGLQELVWDAIQPQTDDNPGGHVWNLPAGWRFSADTDFSMNIDRGVRQLDGQRLNLAQPLYAIALQFKIRVFRNTPLPRQ